MLETIEIYLPKTKRHVKIEIYLPRKRKNIIFDSVYFLDGQNTFIDEHSTYGKSLGAKDTIEALSKKNRPYLGIAIYNQDSELGRINEYMPFKINKGLNANWNKHKITDCFNFCDDLVKTIVPYIEKHYPVYNTIEHRSIYGSSLSAITALYLGFKYNTFKNICAFSTASFLNEESLINFLNDNIKIDRNVFLYVGKCEESDKIFDSTTYFDYSLRLYSYFINHDINTEVKIDDEGLHNETYWGKHLIDFFNFIAK